MSAVERRALVKILGGGKLAGLAEAGDWGKYWGIGFTVKLLLILNRERFALDAVRGETLSLLIVAVKKGRI